jgi:hypothetical protein
MKHIGEFDRDAAVLLGYNEVSGRVLVLNLNQCNDDEVNFLGDLVAGYQHTDYLIPVLENLTYRNMAAFAYFSGKTQQVPVHLVRISDREQCQRWTRSTAQFTDRIVQHRIMDIVRGGGGAYTPPAAPAPSFNQSFNQNNSPASVSAPTPFVAGDAEAALRKAEAALRNKSGGLAFTAPVEEPKAEGGFVSRADFDAKFGIMQSQMFNIQSQLSQLVAAAAGKAEAPAEASDGSAE